MQVELTNVRSFYKAAQKSPFQYFPWKTGTMNFRFLPEDVAFRVRPLGCLHASRNLQAAIGIVSCLETDRDLSDLYDEFERKVGDNSEAKVVRCLAFDPKDEHILQDNKNKSDLVLFPPGQGDNLLSHMEIVMHDFAASMLDYLEQKILTVSPQSISLNSYIDSADFLGSALSSVAFATEDETQRTKRKYGRVQKAMGDYALLSGSPLDATEHYTTAVELSKASQDWVYVSAALEGIITAKLIHEATSRDAFLPSEYSVFHNEGQWRAPVPDSEVLESRRSLSKRYSGSPREFAGRTSESLDTVVSPRASCGPDLSSVMEEPESPVDEGLDKDDPFSQGRFWDTLRSCETLHDEIASILEDCKSAIRRRGALPLLVESELRYARLLAGLKGQKARKKVCMLASSVQRAAELLPLPEDRLVALTEAASILGSVGATRKRVLLLWQAVELSKYFGFPDERTLAVARHALEPSISEEESHDEWSVFKRPLSQDTNIPNSWGTVKAGILEATLGLAIYAKRHADVWDAAAALLREHSKEISRHRIRSLYDNLKTASSNMSQKDKARPGRGPPPILFILGPKPLKDERSLHVMDPEDLMKSPTSPIGSPSTSATPFLYDPFAAKRKQRQAVVSGVSEADSVGWICGEPGFIEIQLYNESPITIKISRMVLHATYNGVPATKEQWKPKVVSLTVPPTSKPVKVTLEATPLVQGDFVLTGCRMTSNEGVSWWAPWSTKPLRTWDQITNECRWSLTPSIPPVGFKSLPPQPFGVLKLKNESNNFESLTHDNQTTELVLNLLQGQKAQGTLTFSNTGPLAIDHASMSVVCDDIETSKVSKIMIDLVDPNGLSSSLPLEPGESVDILVTFSTEMIPLILGQLLSNDILTHKFVMEYTSKHAKSFEKDALQGKCIGRRASCPLNIRIRPSVAFTDLSIEEVWSHVEGQKAWGQECLLIGGFTNRASCNLAVSLVMDDHGEISDGEEKSVSPGESCMVSLMLPRLDRHAGQELNDLSKMSLEYTRQASASWLANRITMKFSGEENIRGSFTLPKGEIYHSLTPHILSLVRDCDVKASICIEGDGVSKGYITIDSTNEAVFSESGVPITRVNPGTELSVDVRISSNAQSPLETRYNIEVSKASFNSANTGDGTIIVQSHGHVENPMSIGMAWSGLINNVSIKVNSQEEARQKLSLTCCSPGWYKIEIADIYVESSDDRVLSSPILVTPTLLYVNEFND